jgi:acyltransferase
MQTGIRKLTQHRVSWIDICRGVAIILVLYGHLFNTDKQRYLIYAFHMPLFFFISGLVFKPTGNKTIKSVTIKYIKQLLIPYYLFALLTYVFAFVSQTWGNFNLGSIAFQLFGIIYGSGNDGMLGYNVVLWFLPCLFITKLCFALITRKIHGTKNILLVLIAGALLGYAMSLFTPWIKLPFGFESALTGLAFFGAGYLAIENKNKLKIFAQQKILLTITTMLFTILIATINYWASGSQIDLRINHLGNGFLFYLEAFSGIAWAVTISQIIARNAFLEYLGRHSLILFAWHNILFVDLENFINSVLDQNLINNVQFLMPTFYVCIAISIILFTRMLVVRLRGAYRYTTFFTQ